jgi:zinc D-Ala-D-Ala carboxypeptidase
MSADLLSPHLSVAEFLATSHRDLVAIQASSWAGAENVRHNACRFASLVFEPVRTVLGAPLHVTSGYRCPALNGAVGGKATSRHILALAADVIPIGLGLDDAMNRIARALASGFLLGVDKAIIERDAWLHIQGAPEGESPRRLALASEDGVVFNPYKGAVA